MYAQHFLNSSFTSPSSTLSLAATTDDSLLFACPSTTAMLSNDLGLLSASMELSTCSLMSPSTLSATSLHPATSSILSPTSVPRRPSSVASSNLPAPPSMILPSQFHQGDYVTSTISQLNQQNLLLYPTLTLPSSSLRTVYLGNLPPLISYEEVLDHVKVGMIEHVKLFEDKNCAFITFLDPSVAQYFVQESQTRPLMIQKREIKVGWGKNTLLSETLLLAVKNGASRNVQIANIENLTVEWLEQTFSVFGHIDQIQVFLDKNMAHVHLTSITAAIKAVVTLSMDARWSSCRIHYGKDRCVPPSANASNLGLPKHLLVNTTTPALANPRTTSPGLLHSPELMSDTRSSTSSSTANHPVIGNRTVYLGGIHPDVTTKDLCDASIFFVLFSKNFSKPLF
jgi:RNA recognition motif-containing protein